MNNRPRLVVWFSCGIASAVTAKLILNRYGDTHDIVVARCVVPEESTDNDRFCRDCESWFGVEILKLRSSTYESCTDVWTKRKYMAGVHGAICTTEMKKSVRWDFERLWNPDFQAFGFTAEERDRADRFRRENPDVRLLTPLIDDGLTKSMCHDLVASTGIDIPLMYRLGFNNNNCIGCVKASSPVYWNRVRQHFPEVFEKMAKLSREIGCRLIRTTTGKRPRLFLDELDPNFGSDEIEPPLDCSILCDSISDYQMAIIENDIMTGLMRDS